MLNYHDTLLPPNQNAFLRDLNRFPEFRKMTPGMRSEIISRAGNDGLKGVLKALDTIFDLGGSDTNPAGYPQMFGTVSDYRLIGGLYDKIGADVR